MTGGMRKKRRLAFPFLAQPCRLPMTGHDFVGPLVLDVLRRLGIMRQISVRFDLAAVARRRTIHALASVATTANVRSLLSERLSTRSIVFPNVKVECAAVVVIVAVGVVHRNDNRLRV
jgi:hypothetical protein